MAGKYSSLSPYNYSFNNPIGFNDPSGADPDPEYSNPNHQYYFHNGAGAYGYPGLTYDDWVPQSTRGEYNSAFGWRQDNVLGWFSGAGSMDRYWHPGDGRLFWSGYEAASRELRYDADAVRFGDMSTEAFGGKYRGIQIYSSSNETIDHYNGRLSIDHKGKTATISQTYLVESDGKTKVSRGALRKLNRIDRNLNRQGFVAETGRLAGYKVKFELKFVSVGTRGNIRDHISNWSRYPNVLTSAYGGNPKGFFAENSSEYPAFLPFNHQADGSYSVRGGVTSPTGSITMNSVFFYRSRLVLHEVFHSLGLRSSTNPHDHNFGSGSMGVLGNRPPTQGDVDALLNIILDKN